MLEKVHVYFVSVVCNGGTSLSRHSQWIATRLTPTLPPILFLVSLERIDVTVLSRNHNTILQRNEANRMTWPRRVRRGRIAKKHLMFCQ